MSAEMYFFRYDIFKGNLYISDISRVHTVRFSHDPDASPGAAR